MSPNKTTESRRAIAQEAALRLVVEGTASETGAEFFRALVKNLAAVMGTAGAWVTEYLPDTARLRPYALWFNGQFVENFEYDIAGTACVRPASTSGSAPSTSILMNTGTPNRAIS